MNLIEVQVDRLVGPTHHFGGLGVGNVASQLHAGQVSNPVAAALQGLDKMRLVACCGAVQLILPPQPRPDFAFLRSLGFSGTDSDVLRRARDESPHLLSAATSCSAMWTANAATVTPGVDAGHQETDLTIANLDASIHRAIEPAQTRNDLRSALPPDCRFHGPLPGGAAMRDEGAANHIRLGTSQERAGINLFVYGNGDPTPELNWPRQSRTACEAIARLHGLPPENTFYFKQHPFAIDSGAFHNDVVAMSHQDLLIHHQRAFQESGDSIDRLESRFQDLTETQLTRIEVPESLLSIDDAVQTYLFNSQILSPISGGHAKPIIICTSQVRNHATAHALVESWCQSGIFERAEYVDLDQSMSGGGGPACLRLRVPLRDSEASATPLHWQWSESLDTKLRETIHDTYATRLSMEDLSRVEFHAHAQTAWERVVKTLAGDNQAEDKP